LRDGQSIIGWYGGKYNLKKYILPFPIHLTYIEVFAGSLVVLFNKVPSDVEVANDINGRLVNMYRSIQEDRREFTDFCTHEYGIDSRKLFNYCKNNVADNKIEDAARMYYINHHSFSQMNESYHGLSFTGKEHWHHPYLNKLREIDEFYKRIQFVQFEEQDFKTLLARCDREGVLLYLDPPYFKGGDLYEYMAGNESEWTMQEFEDLREILSKIKHALFVLSIDKDDFWLEEMPDLYVQPIERINASSLCVGGEKSKDTEYVIRNFNPSKTPTMEIYDHKNKFKSDMTL
jgi:DNA adenine methylase